MGLRAKHGLAVLQEPTDENIRDNGPTVIELLRADRNGLLLKPVSIASGYRAHHLPDRYYSIPRTDLLTRLKLLFERGVLKIERTAAGVDILERELIQFEPGGRQPEHDDLVMALALSVWQAVEDHKELIGMPASPPPRPAARLLRSAQAAQAGRGTRPKRVRCARSSETQVLPQSVLSMRPAAALRTDGPLSETTPLRHQQTGASRGHPDG